MHTLVDFMTHIKGVEYAISVLAIAGFIVFVEILKPKPFRTLKQDVREDLEYMKSTGYRNTLRTVGRLAAAPFIGLAYVVALPFVFAYTFARELSGLAAEKVGDFLGMAGRTLAFGWRPTEAYLSGKKDKKGKTEKSENEDESKKEPDSK